MLYMHDLQGGRETGHQFARPLLMLQLITIYFDEWKGCWSDVAVPSLTQIKFCLSLLNVLVILLSTSWAFLQ
jgi:hypothetical protein